MPNNTWRENFSKYIDAFASTTRYLAHLDGPKVIARPADLSPGEYEITPQAAFFFGIDDPEQRETTARWEDLNKALKTAEIPDNMI